MSRNVVFDEASSWWSSDHTILPDNRELEIELQRKMNSDVMLEPIPEELLEPFVEETSNRSNSPQNPWQSGVHQTRSAEEMRPSQLNDSENEENVTVLRRYFRIPKLNPRYANSVLTAAWMATTDNADSVYEPKSFEEAQGILEWEEAMGEEIKALQQNETWELVHRPTEVTPVSCKWV